MQKKPQTNFMHPIRFRKRKRLADEASESLSQRVIPPLHMRRFTRLFADCRMLLPREDQLVRCPEITKALSGTVSRRDALPQLLARGFRAVAEHVGNHLTSGACERHPQPAFIGSFQHERPHLVEFERHSGGVSHVRLAERVAQLGERLGLFLSQVLTVLRETPKVRDSPRKLLRSSYARKMASRASSV